MQEKQTRMYQIYLALKGFGANSPEKALTATDLASKAGIKDLKAVSTNLSQMTNAKRGVLSRDLVSNGEGMPKVWKYWVIGEYKGRIQALAKPAAAPREKRTYVRRQVTPEGYTLTIVGPADLRAERLISGTQLVQVIDLLKQ
jgi:hypothetical protein